MANIRSIDEKFIKCALKGKVEEMTTLLRQGADIHANNDKALFHAAVNGHAAAVEMLLERGANIHAANTHAADGSLLKSAVMESRSQVVNLLTKDGFDGKNDVSYSLMDACCNGALEIVSLLLSRGNYELCTIKTARKAAEDSFKRWNIKMHEPWFNSDNTENHLIRMEAIISLLKEREN